MKRYIPKLFVWFLFISCSLTILAQQPETDKRILKMAEKEAKKMVREGWKPIVGMPSVVQQIATRKSMECTIDNTGKQQYVCACSQATGPTVDIAMAKAKEEAKYQLVNLIETKVKSETQTMLSESKSQTRTTSSTSSQNVLKNLKDAMALYRECSNHEVEVLVMLAFDRLSTSAFDSNNH